MRKRCHYVSRAGAAAALLALAAACAAPSSPPGSGVRVVAVEAVYGDVVSQIAGRGAQLTTILDSPSADPHAYEPTTRDADAIADADLVIENGLGYDAFVDKLLAASPRVGRTVIVVGTLAGRRPGDNPHVWYDSEALRTLTRAVVVDLSRRSPHERRALSRNSGRFRAWLDGFARRTLTLGRRYGGTQVAITEPVFDAVLHAAALRIATPSSFAKAIEEGDDPAPQDIAAMRALLAGRHVAALINNRQTIEPSTTHLLQIARSSGVPVVGVTETLPPGMHVQSWFDGELRALTAALVAGRNSRSQVSDRKTPAVRHAP